MCSLSIGAAALAPAAHAADKPAMSTAMQKTGTQFKADADMQAVLDELASLNGKPIESLTPEEARKQPTPADAVMSLLKKKGKDKVILAFKRERISVPEQVMAAGDIDGIDKDGRFTRSTYFR